MRIVTLKSLAITFLSSGIFLLYLESALQAKEKPQEVMDRIRALSIGILEKALQSENAFIRSAAARAAGESEYSGLIPLLKKAAKDPYHTTRLLPCRELRKFHWMKPVRWLLA